MNRLLEQYLGQITGGLLGGGKDASNPAFGATSPDKGKTWLNQYGQDVTKAYESNGNTNPVRNPTSGEKIFNPEYSNQIENQRNQYSLNPAFSQQKQDIQQGLTVTQIDALKNSGLLGDKVKNIDSKVLSTMLNNNPNGIEPSELETQLEAAKKISEGIVEPAAKAAVSGAKVAAAGEGQAEADIPTTTQTQHEQNVGQNSESKVNAAISGQRQTDIPSLQSTQKFQDTSLGPLSAESQYNQLVNPAASPFSMFAPHFDPNTRTTYYTINPSMMPQTAAGAAEANMKLRMLNGVDGGNSGVGTAMGGLAASIGAGGLIMPSATSGTGVSPSGGLSIPGAGTRVPVGTGGMTMRSGNVQVPSAYPQSQQIIQPAVANNIPTRVNPVNQPFTSAQGAAPQNIDSVFNQRGILPAIGNAIASPTMAAYNYAGNLISPYAPSLSQIGSALMQPNPQYSAPLPITQGMNPQQLADYQDWLQQRQKTQGETNMIPTSISAF